MTRADFAAASTGHRDLDRVAVALAGVFGIEQLEPGRWIVLTPFAYGDGDGISVFITRRAEAWTLSDFGALRINPDGRPGYPTEQVTDAIGRIADQYGITYQPDGPAYRDLDGRPPRPDEVGDFVMFTIAAATVAGSLPNGLAAGAAAVPTRPQE